MKRTPHTSCRKGKRVLITLVTGRRMVTKFIERTPKFILTEAGKFTVEQVRSFGIYKSKNKEGKDDLRTRN